MSPLDPARLAQASSLVVLSPEDRAQLARFLVPVRHPSGYVLLEQGASSEAAWLQLSGTLAVRLSAPRGSINGHIRPGEWVGSISVLDGRPSTARVVAVTDVELARLDRSTLETLLRRPDGLGARLLRAWLASLSFQLDRLNSAVVQLRDAITP